jgi:hypothetical protein
VMMLGMMLAKRGRFAWLVERRSLIAGALAPPRPPRRALLRVVMCVELVWCESSGHGTGAAGNRGCASPESCDAGGVAAAWLAASRRLPCLGRGFGAGSGAATAEVTGAASSSMSFWSLSIVPPSSALTSASEPEPASEPAPDSEPLPRITVLRLVALRAGREFEGVEDDDDDLDE